MAGKFGSVCTEFPLTTFSTNIQNGFPWNLPPKDMWTSPCAKIVFEKIVKQSFVLTSSKNLTNSSYLWARLFFRWWKFWFLNFFFFFFSTRWWTNICTLKISNMAIYLTLTKYFKLCHVVRIIKDLFQPSNSLLVVQDTFDAKLNNIWNKISLLNQISYKLFVSCRLNLLHLFILVVRVLTIG